MYHISNMLMLFFFVCIGMEGNTAVGRTVIFIRQTLRVEYARTVEKVPALKVQGRKEILCT